MLLNLLSNFNFIILSTSTWNSSPRSLNLISPHVNFHFVLINLGLYFILPIHISFVLSKLTFKPEICENFSSNSRVLLIYFSEPSKKSVVSSANCNMIYSSFFIFSPVIFLSCFNLILRISVQRIKI